MVKKDSKKKKTEEEKIDEVEKKISRKKQVEAENRILRNIFVGIIIVVVAILAIVLFLKSVRTFEYQGVNFQVVKFCDAGPCLVTYNTKLPIIYEGKDAEYNFYLRNDPRKLGENVPFIGEINLAQNVVINSTSDFNCDGDVGIAMGNLGNLFSISRINAVKDANITGCDSQGRYGFINLQEGNQTSVEEIGPSCYNININNCEIVKAMERFMLEDFVKINKILKE